MAQLYGPWNPATDSNGARLPYAKLYTYEDASHSTLQTTYNDPDLAGGHEHTNPIIADAAGVFPQVFAATGLSYYLVLKDADGVQIDTYEAMDTLGSEDNSTFSRDFGVNGRVDMRGSGGAVLLEFGNATGDDIGGAAVVSGWNSTDLDTLQIKSTATSLTGSLTSTTGISDTSGLVTLAGIARAVPRCTVRGSATAATTTLIALDSSYECWDIELRNLLVNGSGGTPAVRLSFDGSTVKSASGDYYAGGAEQGNSALTNVPWASATSIQIGSALTSSSETGSGGDYSLRVTSKSTRETRVWSQYLNFDVATAADRVSGWRVGSTNNKAYGKCAAIQIFDALGGTLTFDYVVIGRP